MRAKETQEKQREKEGEKDKKKEIKASKKKGKEKRKHEDTEKKELAESKKRREEKEKNKKEKEEEDVSQKLSIREENYERNSGSNLSVVDKEVTMENILKTLIEKEVQEKCKDGYLIAMNDLKEMTEETIEYLRMNTTMVENLKGMTEPEVLQLINFKLHDGAI